MKRSSSICAAAVVLVMALIPTAAAAAVVELGATHTAVTAPVCPVNLPAAQCTIVLTRATALQTIRDGVAYPTTVTRPGRIVAFTVGLSALSSNRTTRKNFIHSLDLRYAGTTQIALTVLRATGPKRKHTWKVVEESPLIHVEPYLGLVVQIPLETTLPVSRGDVVALSTPTWAPVLSIQQTSKKFAYRQSRSANCSSPPATPQAQLTINQVAAYGCNYPGTRAEYTATEITTTPYPKHYVHAPYRR
jgi:hypothetical protein